MQPDTTFVPRRRGRIAVLVSVVVLLIAGGGFAYWITRDDGRFSATPPVCDTIRPLVPRLGVYELKNTTYDRMCELWLPEDDPGYVDAWKISVGFYGDFDEGGPEAPESVPDMMREIATKAEPVAGPGDEAYRWDDNRYIRVSNLIIVITVMPLPVSTDAQIDDFAAALVGELGKL